MGWRKVKHWVSSFLSGEGLRKRAWRGAAVSLMGVGSAQFLRLASNLVLTRLLFPEAFGMMALIQAFVTGLEMFSDIGVRTSIIQNERQDKEFLNTAWTVQIVRGFMLWVGSCALAWPVAIFYDEPMLAWIMPVVGLTPFISGFTTTNIASANRELKLFRQTAIGLCSQAAGIAVMIVLAWMTKSVWSLVVGGLFGAALKVVLCHLLLPGIRNRLQWDRSAAHELTRFGKYIALSTIASFLINQGDRLVLGKLITLSELAIYNIGIFLALFPGMLSKTVVDKVVFPLYSAKRPSAGAENKRKIGEARMLLNGTTYAISALFAVSGVALVQFLYDPRYHDSGPILVLFSLALLPGTIVTTYSSLLLAEGNSRNFAGLTMLRAVLRISLMLAGFYFLGLFGVMLAPFLVALLSYPVMVSALRRYDGWDARHDLMFLLAGIAIAVVAVAVNWGPVSEFVTRSVAGAPAWVAP